MKGICYENTPILGSFSGYRENLPHNRLIDSHWTQNHIAVKSVA